MVGHIKGTDFSETIKYLASRYAPHLAKNSETEKVSPIKYLYKLSLKNKRKANVALESRNITCVSAGYVTSDTAAEMLKLYTVKELEEAKLLKNNCFFIQNRIILPIISNGGFKGVIARGSNPKTILLGDASTDRWLYNLNKKSDHIVVVEGEYDALTVERAGYKSCAICGSASKITPERLKLLSDKKRIDLMFDNDPAGYKATETFFDAMQKVLDHVDVRVCNYDRDDPNECSDEEIMDAVEGSVSIWNWAVDEMTSEDLDGSVWKRASFIRKYKPIMDEKVFNMIISVVDSRLRYVY
jgi:DNA primase